jgi:hypothetical protein
MGGNNSKQQVFEIDDYGSLSLDSLNSLPDLDKKIIAQIEMLLKLLSEKGREYWMAYYG